MKKTVFTILLVFQFIFGQIKAQETHRIRETRGAIILVGNPLILLGEPIIVDQLDPNFTAVDIADPDVKLSNFIYRIVIIATISSADTKVCAKESREFNQRSSELDKRVAVLTISKYFPFKLGRFFDAEGYTLSDYKASEFGLKYGFLIKENQLLDRGVIIIDKDVKIVYV